MILGRSCEALKDSADTKQLEEEFEKLKRSDETLARMQHWKNSFESGPQLWFKMYLLFHHLFSGKEFCMHT